MGELSEASVYVVYEWDCPECGLVNRLGHDDRGEEAQCEDCKTRVILQ